MLVCIMKQMFVNSSIEIWFFFFFFALKYSFKSSQTCSKPPSFDTTHDQRRIKELGTEAKAYLERSRHLLVCFQKLRRSIF